MKKISYLVCALLTCLTAMASADGFSEEDAALLAGKDFFPGDDGSTEEATLPETQTNTNPSSGQDAPTNVKTGKDTERASDVPTESDEDQEEDSDEEMPKTTN